MNGTLRLLIFPLALLLAGSAAASSRAVPIHRPNVLLIIADDLTKTLPCYGYPIARTPNVDRLAARSVRFDRAYCQYPLCMPSRASFLSGRRPENTGILGNVGKTQRTPQLRDAIFLPQHFRANGYFTARLGKVFHIGRDVAECWDISEEGTPNSEIIYTPLEDTRLGLKENTIAHFELARDGNRESASYSVLGGGKEKLIDVRNGQRAAELIAEHAGRAQPFFLACGFRRPHQPHTVPAPSFVPYPTDKMPLPVSGGPSIPGSKPVSAHESQEALRGYLASVTFMDEQLGHVLDSLDTHRLWDNTIVVFMGDHGYLLGSRGGWWGKEVLYDEAASTVLLVAAPGMARGTLSPRVVEFIDLYPTLAELCGLPQPTGIDGRSFAPLLAEPAAPWDHAAYTTVATRGHPTGLAVSTERFRYLENADGSQELFDIKADPREWENLFNEPKHAESLAQLQKLAAEYKRAFRNQ
ncbi:MAG: sulfatase [Opitutaceae bacterium]|nr:sulfatase [Opitutaceae bacterium]